ncbi:MAG: aspartate decarboxylase [Oceanicaulis sp.]
MSDAKPALGSKANPSQYDCLPDLAEDEPYFVIRADDPLASALIELHAYIGAGQAGAAHNKLAEIMELTRERAPRPAGSPKYRETFAISQSMEKWRHAHGK